MTAMKRNIVLLITALLLAATAVPAFAAGPEDIEITNRTGGEVYIILRGPTKATLMVPVGVSKTHLLEGAYTYKYEACGSVYQGSFTVDDTGANLILRCRHGAETTLVINNQTGRAFRLMLDGKKSYALWIVPGRNRVTVASGAYDFSAVVCGGVEDGRLRAKGSGLQFWGWSCD
jgi:hypothetical protein